MTDNGMPVDGTSPINCRRSTRPSRRSASCSAGGWGPARATTRRSSRSTSSRKLSSRTSASRTSSTAAAPGGSPPTADGELERNENGDLVRLEPLAVEAGFWRPQPEGKVEVALSHPTGISEIYYGQLTGLHHDRAGDRRGGQDPRPPSPTWPASGCTAWCRTRPRRARRTSPTPSTWPPWASLSPRTCGPSSSGIGSTRDRDRQGSRAPGGELWEQGPKHQGDSALGAMSHLFVRRIVLKLVRDLLQGT